MRFRLTSAAAAATLGGLALLGTAPSAFAATPASVTPTTCPSPAPDLGVSLSGLTNIKLVAGGGSANGSASLVNNSGKTLKNTVTFLEFGPKSANHATSDLTVQEFYGGTWHPLTYHVDSAGNSFVVLGVTPTLAPKGKDGGQFRVSAPKGAPLGTYEALVISGTVAAGTAASPKDLGNVATGSSLDNTTSATVSSCTTHLGFDHHEFSVVKAGVSPTPSPSPTKSTPAPASGTPTAAAPSAASTGKALATTGGGSDSGMIAGAAGALVVAGGAGVLVARRRKAAHN